MTNPKTTSAPLRPEADACALPGHTREPRSPRSRQRLTWLLRLVIAVAATTCCRSSPCNARHDCVPSIPNTAEPVQRHVGAVAGEASPTEGSMKRTKTQAAAIAAAEAALAAARAELTPARERLAAAQQAEKDARANIERAEHALRRARTGHWGLR